MTLEILSAAFTAVCIVALLVTCSLGAMYLITTGLSRVMPTVLAAAIAFICVATALLAYASVLTRGMI